ncbi:MAG: nucleotidyltransferase domain-containing protein [Acidimicrobiales bacterium]|jgi:predicted nucleotidyltransferase
MAGQPLPLSDLVASHRDEIRTIVKSHRGRSVALFGSVARGTETAESDIDLLVEFGPGASLFDLVRIQHEVQALTGVAVDVVSVGGLTDDDNDVRREAVLL